MRLSDIFRFILFLGIQLLIFDNIEIGGYINPFFYVLFILSLPFDIPLVLLLLASFAMGMSMDTFHHTYGMHATASVFIAYIRSFVINFLLTGKEYDKGTIPGIENMGLGKYVSFVGILVLFHHFIYFFLEVFRFSNFFDTFFRIILSSIATLILIIIYQLIFSKEKK